MSAAVVVVGAAMKIDEVVVVAAVGTAAKAVVAVAAGAAVIVAPAIGGVAAVAVATGATPGVTRSARREFSQPFPAVSSCGADSDFFCRLSGC